MCVCVCVFLCVRVLAEVLCKTYLKKKGLGCHVASGMIDLCVCCSCANVLQSEAVWGVTWQVS